MFTCQTSLWSRGFPKFHLEKLSETRYKMGDRVEALLMLASSVICEVQP
jgi:hypothetical protein